MGSCDLLACSLADLHLTELFIYLFFSFKIYEYITSGVLYKHTNGEQASLA